MHETYREFCDQLIEEAEVEPIFTILVNTIRSHFRDKIHVIFDKLCNEDGSVGGGMGTSFFQLIFFIVCVLFGGSLSLCANLKQ